MIDLPELLILDVGHGNCAILRDTMAVTVIDCGYDGVTLIETLERLGIDEVDHILISHADIDHIGGLVPLVEEISVRNIYLNADASKKGRTWKDILITLESAEKSRKTKVHIGLTSGYSKEIISGEVDIEILAPSASVAASGPGGIDQDGHTLVSNSMSVVIGLIHDSCRTVLLPGDMDETGLKNLLRNHKEIEAKILVFPHHGGNPGSADGLEFAQSLCNLVQPSLVIFSLQRELYDNPKENIVHGVVTALPNAHIVCTQLSQKCSPVLISSDFSHLNSLPAKGRSSNICCGGTIRIKIDGDRTAYTPLYVLHRQFVKGLSSPLCLQHLNKL